MWPLLPKDCNAAYCYFVSYLSYVNCMCSINKYFVTMSIVMNTLFSLWFEGISGNYSKFIHGSHLLEQVNFCCQNYLQNVTNIQRLFCSFASLVIANQATALIWLLQSWFCLCYEYSITIQKHMEWFYELIFSVGKQQDCNNSSGVCGLPHQQWLP